MLQDADKQTNETGEKPANKTVQIGFVCPEAFEPAAFFVVAMDKEGREFVNTTNQPHLALHLATIGIKFASKMAVEHIQHEARQKSPIIKASGVIPPWPGPAGRG